MAHICIDEDDDFANDVTSLRRQAAALNKTEQPVDNERSIRRLRRNSAKQPYLQSSRSRKGNKRQADDNYVIFLNLYDKASAFQLVDGTDADVDLQYYKFLSYLKPFKNSYVLEPVKGSRTSALVTYEDVNETSDQPTHNAKPNMAPQEKNYGKLHHVSVNMIDIGERNCFKSTDKPSETLGRSVAEDKKGAQNAGHPLLEESLIVGSENTSLKSVGTDSQMCSIDVSYQFHLCKTFNLKFEENIRTPQDSKKQYIRSVAENTTKETPRKRKLGSKVLSGHIFDGIEGKKPRLSQTSGKIVNTPLDANDIHDANGDPKSRMTKNLRQNMGSKNERERSHCQTLGNSRQKKLSDKAIQKDGGMQASNDKQSKRHRLGEDNYTSGRRSVALKFDQEGNGTAVSLKVTLDDKLGKNHRVSRLKQDTERTLVDRVADDATGLYALYGIQSSGKKPGPKNRNQPGSELKFDRPVSEGYKVFLSGLRDKEGHLVFQSEEGKVVTYEKGLKGSSTDSESDSDSVIITGDRVNGIRRKYCSFGPRKSSFQGLELDKSKTSKDSPFRKKLMNILRKPYDQEEYESLMEIAEKRRPLEGYRDLRRGRKGTYELESLGKSYLDHHKDAVRAIRRCKGDHHKVLIILRGFMYWLVHIADPNEFKPWMDEECLEVQPRNSSL